MRYATLLFVALVLLGCQPVSTISVDPKAEVSSAAIAWEAAVNTANSCDASAISALYADGAVLWGTTRTSLITTPQGIHDYFATSCKALPGVKVQFGDQVVRVYPTISMPVSIAFFDLGSPVISNGEEEGGDENGISVPAREEGAVEETDQRA